MDVSLYSAAAAMNATERWQDLVAENLSSTSVPGARMQEISFDSVQAGLASAAPGSVAQNFVMPAAGSTTNFAQGNLKATNDNMDFALEGPGFFSATLSDNSTVYTRDGEFKVNAQGQLVTKQGYPVVSAGGALTFDPNNSAPITVAANGQVTQGVDIKGQIAVTEFGNLKGVTKSLGGYYSASAAAQPKAATNTTVRQGFVEESNAVPSLQMACLLLSMRMFESNQKVMTMQSDRMSKTITELSGA